MVVVVVVDGQIHRRVYTRCMCVIKDCKFEREKKKQKRKRKRKKTFEGNSHEADPENIQIQVRCIHPVRSVRSIPIRFRFPRWHHISSNSSYPFH